jgi:hypothetical protein
MSVVKAGMKPKIQVNSRLLLNYQAFSNALFLTQIPDIFFQEGRRGKARSAAEAGLGRRVIYRKRLRHPYLLIKFNSRTFRLRRLGALCWASQLKLPEVSRPGFIFYFPLKNPSRYRPGLPEYC